MKLARLMNRIIVLARYLIFLSLVLLSGSLAAQEAPASGPEPVDQMTPEAIREMMATMSDDDVRALFLEWLEAVPRPPPAEEPMGFVARIDALWSAFTRPIAQGIAVLPDLPAQQAEAFSVFLDRFGGASGVAVFLGLVLLTLALALASEMVVRRFVKLKEPDAPASDDRSLRPTLRYLAMRLLREMLGLVVFYVALRAIAPLLLTPEQISVAAPAVLFLVWMPRLMAAVSRFVLSPGQPKKRLVGTDDATAGFLHAGLCGLVLWIGFTGFLTSFNLAHGMRPSETFLGFWLDSFVYVYVAVFAWMARNGLQRMMRNGDTELSRVDERVAQAYPYYVIALAGLTWLLATTLIGLGRVQPLLRGAHYTTLACFVAAPVLDVAVRGLVRRLVPPMRGEGPAAEAAHQATKRSYVRIGRVFVIGGLLLLISSVWGYNLAVLISDRPGIVDNLLRFFLTLVVGYIVYELCSLWINRRLEHEKTVQAPGDEDAEMGGAGGSRLFTVLPLALVTARVAIASIFILLAIGNLGIDIAPLLAGFGVVGLAIGFGAQKLVTDVVSGVFFLVDDAFRIGEYVEIGGTMGTVERISVRSMTLRHHRGPLHTIPYGEIPKLTNYSRDWVIMKLKFRVDFDTDPNKVKKIFKAIGADMIEDPAYKDDMMEPFKSQGVFDFDDIGMIIRGKFMAKPGKQFTIRKEIYNRVKAAFAENDIRFARREVRIEMPQSDHAGELTQKEREAIERAAASVAET